VSTAKSKSTPKPVPRTTKRFRDEGLLKKLGARIKKLRIAKGYSLDRIYLEGEGLNRSSVSRIERGLTDPQVSTLKRIAETIGVKLIDLLNIE
jgi:transcriptional regulator with XRE-family HTH domain